MIKTTFNDEIHKMLYDFGSIIIVKDNKASKKKKVI